MRIANDTRSGWKRNERKDRGDNVLVPSAFAVGLVEVLDGTDLVVKGVGDVIFCFRNSAHMVLGALGVQSSYRGGGANLQHSLRAMRASWQGFPQLMCLQYRMSMRVMRVSMGLPASLDGRAEAEKTEKARMAAIDLMETMMSESGRSER